MSTISGRGHSVAVALTAIAAATALSLGVILPAHAAATTVVVDPDTRFQTLEGWGTSFAWWANVLGGWDSPTRDQVADLLFSDSGLGLNVIRYNLGAGTNPNPDKKMRVGAEVPTYNPSSGVWDWSADGNQRWMLSAAQSRGTNLIVEGFVNSPPAWMLANACTAGAPNGDANLLTSNNATFASYIGEVAQHFATSWSTTFRSVSPFNEPNSYWWKCSNNQEGNKVPRSQQDAIIQAVSSELVARGLQTGVIGGEEYAVGDSLASWNSYSAAAQNVATQINTHTYSSSGASGLNAVARAAGKRLWVSEVGVGGTADHNHADLTSALQLADRITSDLTELRPDAWVYWQAVEDEAGNNNYGFIHANFTGSQSYWVTKQYYAMANFSRYIRPGSIVLHVNDDGTLAAFDPAAGKLVLVSRNSDSSGGELPFDLSRFGTVTGSAARYETSATNSATKLSDVAVSANRLSVTLPAQSITTLVLSGLTLPGIGANVLTNPGFEDQVGLAGWTAEWNPSLASIDTLSPQSGARNAVLRPTATKDVGLSQTFTAASSGRYTFSAYADTNLANGVQLGIDVDGVRVDSRPVVGSAGYRRYELSATVEAGQKVKVWYYANKQAGWASLDTTSLAFRPTLLANAGFEAGSLSGWTAEWNPSRALIETNFPFTGRYDGALNPTTSADVALAQTVTAPATRTYTISAKVATSLSNVRFGVDVVGGSQVVNLTAPANVGYQEVRATFTANKDQKIKVWYYSPAGAGWATIDDVALN